MINGIFQLYLLPIDHTMKTKLFVCICKNEDKIFHQTDSYMANHWTFLKCLQYLKKKLMSILQKEIIRQESAKWNVLKRIWINPFLHQMDFETNPSCNSWDLWRRLSYQWLHWGCGYTHPTPCLPWRVSWPLPRTHSTTCSHSRTSGDSALCWSQ